MNMEAILITLGFIAIVAIGFFFYFLHGIWISSKDQADTLKSIESMMKGQPAQELSVNDPKVLKSILTK